MADRSTSIKVDAFIEREEKWQAEFAALRRIILDCDCGLVEDFKWGVPCYTFQGQNVVLIHGFKAYCAVLFVKGALLQDPHGILVQQTENVQAARQARFTSVAEIEARAEALRASILEAVEIERSGREIDFKKTAEFAMPDELRLRFESQPELKAAFEALTPGRQRAYLLHFSAPKQATTREARIEKAAPRIMAGKGLND